MINIPVEKRRPGYGLYDLTICCLFVYLTTTSYVLLLYVRRFSQVCSDTPPCDDTQFWNSLISSIDYKKYVKIQKMQLSHSLAQHGNLENIFRTIRCATSEDSDHLLMPGQSDFAVCGNKQAM